MEETGRLSFDGAHASMKNKFPKMPTPRFRHPHGKGWPLSGKNRAQRQRIHMGIAAKGGRTPQVFDLRAALSV